MGRLRSVPDNHHRYDVQPVSPEIAAVLQRHPQLRPKRGPEWYSGRGDDDDASGTGHTEDWSLTMACELEGAGYVAIANRLRAVVVVLADPKVSGYRHMERCLDRILKFHASIRATEPGEWADRHPLSAAATFVWYTAAELVAMVHGSHLLARKFLDDRGRPASRSTGAPHATDP